MIIELLKICLEKGASDLHFKVGYPPILRIDGAMVPVKTKEIDALDFENMLEAILDDSQMAKFMEHDSNQVILTCCWICIQSIIPIGTAAEIGKDVWVSIII